jgi:hypothetical protein
MCGCMAQRGAGRGIGQPVLEAAKLASLVLPNALVWEAGILENPHF